MFPIHPFLIGLYPIFALYTQNMGIVPLGEILIPSIITLTFTALLFLVARLFHGNIDKMALGITAFFLWFYSFGFSLGAYNQIIIGDIALNQYPRYLVFIYTGIFITFIVYLWRLRSDFRTITRLLNIIAIVLIALPFLVAGFSLVTVDRNVQETVGAKAPPEISCIPNRSIQRDVYYIILDSYARDDVLDHSFHYNNSDFLSYLTARGFQVSRRSTANYNLTRPSLASSLNLNYIENPDDRTDLQHMVEYNNMTLFFKDNGYTTIFFRSGYAMTERSPYSTVVMNNEILSAFQSKLLDVTLLKYIFTNENRRSAISGAFSDLSTIPEIQGNTFVFAHIVAPHNPYIFSEDGGWVVPSFRDEDYIRQLKYVNAQVEQTIDTILEKSDVPPIIVLQADHGPSMEAMKYESRDIRMPILNAYYLPEGRGNRIPDTITPVNSFRLILNEYYGCELPLLEDRYFFNDVWYSTSPGDNMSARYQENR
ncbi:MAG: sulfatase-like hydrolase/transferase [Methanomicrobiales archaeon]|nr:sulfatase-like hydrolase/transferase [Methanomicrobiales archaeon]